MEQIKNGMVTNGGNGTNCYQCGVRAEEKACEMFTYHELIEPMQSEWNRIIDSNGTNCTNGVHVQEDYKGCRASFKLY